MENSGADYSGLKIYLMGGFSVQLEGVWIGEEHWHSKRAHHLITLLALAPGHQMQREQIAETLWPDSDLSASLNNFHQSLHGLRQALGPAGIDCLVLEGGMLRLFSPGRRAVTVDVDQFEAAAAAESVKDIAGCSAALDLYRGDLLPEDIYTEWTISRRDKLREIYLRLLYQQAGLYELGGAYRQGIDVLKRLVALDPCHEEGHIALMRLYACSGERVLAVRQYHVLQAQLKKDLDVEPGEAALQLFHAIQSGKLAASVGARGKAEPAGQPRPGELGREADPVKTEAFHPTRHNLPRQLTSFIGREREVEHLLNLVKAHPLVTVTGAGGTGKTRLALQAAEQLLGQFPDGVYIVELAPLFDPALVSLACIQVLELFQQADVTPGNLLARFIGNKRLLLIFDTCEHVVAACAQLASQLLQHCSELHILTTSREILSASGEIAFRVPPLSYPQQSGLLSLDEIGAHEAVRLFVDRARQVSPDFALNMDNAALVAQICRRLDGLPLAIELAAARLRMLSVGQIAGRLDHAFLLLTNGSRTALPRQQTLLAMIDWSYNLLSPLEKALLLHLTVFSGGWSLAAAEVICASTGEMAGTDTSRSEAVLDLLGHLVDKSLVLIETRAGLEPRYHMLDTVRQYAHDRLREAGGEAVLRDRHLAFFCQLAEEAELHLRARGGPEWMDRLEMELANLRLALEWSFSASVERGLRLASALFNFWHIRGHRLEGIQWLDRLLEADEQEIQSARTRSISHKITRGKALLVAGNLNHYYAGIFHEHSVKQIKEAKAFFAEFGDAARTYLPMALNLTASSEEDQRKCLAAARAVGDDFYAAEALWVITLFLTLRGEVAQALAFAQENLAIRQRIGDLDGEAFAYYHLSSFAIIQGNPERALELWKVSERLVQTIGNQEFGLSCSLIQSAIALVQGDYRRAKELAEAVLEVGYQISSNIVVAYAIGYVCWALWAMEEYDQVPQRCAEALGPDWENCLPCGRGTLFYVFGRVALSQGDYSRSRAYLEGSLDIAIPERFLGIQSFGIIAAATGQVRRAAVIFGGLEKWCPWLGNYSAPIECQEYADALQTVRATLSDEEFQTAWSEGRAMTWNEAVEYVQQAVPTTLA